MTHRTTSIALLPLLACLVACEPEEPRTDAPPPDASPPLGEVEETADHAIDPALRAGMADRLDERATELDTHTSALRIISPEHFLRDRALHRSRVEDFLTTLAETLAAARAEAPGEPAAAHALGLQRGRHRALAEEVSEVRRELRHIETLEAEEVPDWLPAHVDRLNRLIETAQSIAAHLRRS